MDIFGPSSFWNLVVEYAPYGCIFLQDYETRTTNGRLMFPSGNLHPGLWYLSPAPALSE